MTAIMTALLRIQEYSNGLTRELFSGQFNSDEIEKYFNDIACFVWTSDDMTGVVEGICQGYVTLRDQLNAYKALFHAVMRTQIQGRRASEFFKLMLDDLKTLAYNEEFKADYINDLRASLTKRMDTELGANMALTFAKQLSASIPSMRPVANDIINEAINTVGGIKKWDRWCEYFVCDVSTCVLDIGIDRSNYIVVLKPILDLLAKAKVQDVMGMRLGRIFDALIGMKLTYSELEPLMPYLTGVMAKIDNEIPNAYALSKYGLLLSKSGASKAEVDEQFDSAVAAAKKIDPRIYARLEAFTMIASNMIEAKMSNNRIRGIIKEIDRLSNRYGASPRNLEEIAIIKIKSGLKNIGTKESFERAVKNNLLARSYGSAIKFIDKMIELGYDKEDAERQRKIVLQSSGNYFR